MQPREVCAFLLDAQWRIKELPATQASKHRPGAKQDASCGCAVIGRDVGAATQPRRAHAHLFGDSLRGCEGGQTDANSSSGA